MDIANLSLDELKTKLAETITALNAAMAVEWQSEDDATKAEELAADRKQLEAAVKEAEEAAAKEDDEKKKGKAPDFAERKAALGKEFAEEDPEPEPGSEGGDPDPEPEPEPEPGNEGGEGAEASDIAKLANAILASINGDVQAARAAVTTRPVASIADVAAKLRRPEAPKLQRSGQLSLVASANVPDFAPGTALDGLDGLGEAIVSVMRGFTPPNGDGGAPDLRKFGVAKIQVPFEDAVVAKPDDPGSALRAVEAAISMARLNGVAGVDSLVAAGGWCAPSETLYDLPADESTDGILSLPEIQVSRGGIRYTLGPQFADFYAEAGFVQTEAQAIAATVKPCYEVDCPSFVEVRMDAVGVCIKVPILTQAGYPELVNRFSSGTLIAHQHMVNANVIGRIVTSAGAARVFTADGSTTSEGATFTDTLAAFQLVAEQRRQTYRLSFSKAMEAVLPHWTLGMFKADMSRRVNASPADPIVDALIDAWFRAMNINPQWVYDWQDLSLTAEAYPADFNALLYPQGTFTKGVSDVINLSAVYDAASLSTNMYTGLFMEQGLLVARRQYAADLVTIPVNNAGRTGANDLGAVAA